MPPRAAPTTLILRVKSHKTSVFVTISSSATVATLKEFVQSAFNAHASPEAERGLPLPIDSLDNFILALRRPGPKSKPIFVDIPEDDSASLSKHNVRNWDAVYVRWRREGVYKPVEVTLPSLLGADSDDGDNDDEEEVEPASMSPPPPNQVKGKGKAKA